MSPMIRSCPNANRLIKERLTGIAMRKQGLTEPHYLSPLTRQHDN
jgi:agmatinase